MNKLFLNYGHGGNDSGATGNGLLEKNLTKKIGSLIVKKLKKYNVTVKTYQQKGNEKLKHITDSANLWKADYFLSIHINAGGGTGFESYAYSGNVPRETLDYRNIVHDEIMKSIKSFGVSNRGKKRANFHVLRETKMNAILTENLFIDTKKDANLLKDDKFINAIAQGHVNGIVKVMNLEKKNTEDSDNSTVYRVVTGSFKSKKNADERVKELKKKGYESFITDK